MPTTEKYDSNGLLALVLYGSLSLSLSVSRVGIYKKKIIKKLVLQI